MKWKLTLLKLLTLNHAWNLGVFGLETEATNDKLVGVIFVHTYGDRSPLSFLPIEEENNKYWLSLTGNGRGELTMKGIKQMHGMGKFLNKKYITGAASTRILPEQIESQERYAFRAESVSSGRCLSSVAALHAGLFPIGTVGNQIIPIYPTDLQLETPTDEFCPRVAQLRDEKQVSDKWKQKEIHSRALIDQISLHVSLLPHLRDLSLVQIQMIQDPLRCDINHNLRMPEGVTEADYENLTMLNNWVREEVMCFSDSEKKLYSGNMISKVVSALSLMALETKTKKPRMVEICIEESSLFALFCSLSETKFELRNDFGSGIIFEVFSPSQTNAEPYVKVFHNTNNHANHLTPVELSCNKIETDGCTISNFRKAFNHLIPVNYANQECKIVPVERSSTVDIVAFCILLIAILFLLFPRIVAFRASGYQPLR